MSFECGARRRDETETNANARWREPGLSALPAPQLIAERCGCCGSTVGVPTAPTPAIALSRPGCTASP